MSLSVFEPPPNAEASDFVINFPFPYSIELDHAMIITLAFIDYCNDNFGETVSPVHAKSTGEFVDSLYMLCEMDEFSDNELKKIAFYLSCARTLPKQSLCRRFIREKVIFSNVLCRIMYSNMNRCNKDIKRKLHAYIIPEQKLEELFDPFSLENKNKKVTDAVFLPQVLRWFGISNEYNGNHKYILAVFKSPGGKNLKFRQNSKFCHGFPAELSNFLYYSLIGTYNIH
jgi:hypothetical protein